MFRQATADDAVSRDQGRRLRYLLMGQASIQQAWRAGLLSAKVIEDVSHCGTDWSLFPGSINLSALLNVEHLQT